MATIRKKVMEKVLNELRSAKRASTMEHANFDDMFFDESKLPKTSKEITPYIKEKTRLFRHSWITSPIERAIQIIKEELER